MATKTQELLSEEQTPQTETNSELEEMVREEMHDAEGLPLQTETEMTETDENSEDLSAAADAKGALSQTGTEEPKKARGRKKTESQKTGRILTGTIQGVERPLDNPSRSLAVIYHGEFKVIIPVEEAVEPLTDYRGRPPGGSRVTEGNCCAYT